jgi:hypothetical protein
MSDETSETRPTRSGPGLILSGLAASAILGAPVVAAAAPVVAESVATVASQVRSVHSAAESVGASIQEQFRTAFTPGAMTDPSVENPTVICGDA